MITKMFDYEEETLTYEPTSFVAQIPNVNPDSPRHFKSKRRRNNGNPKLKHRPQSLIDFRAVNQKKEQTTDGFGNKRSKTLMERCRVALQRTISMDILLGNSQSEEDKNLDMNENSSNSSKPIISRRKIREIRKVNTMISNRPYGKAPLTRSRSDTGTYYSSKDTDEPAERQCQSTLINSSSSCEYTDDNSVKTRVYDYFNRDNSNSIDSFKTKSDCSPTSSPNSSGCCDYTGTESENDTLSSDGSSVITSDILFQDTTSSMDILFDKDKNAEEKLYARSLEKNRRPLSIVRNTGIVRERSGNSPTSLSPSGIVDNVFSMDEYVDDSGIENNISTNTTPSPKRTYKNNGNKNKHKKNRQSRAKSMGDIRAVSIDNISAATTFPVIQSEYDVLTKSETKDNGRLTIEQYVEKLSLSPKNNNSSTKQENSPNKKEKKKR